MRLLRQLFLNKLKYKKNDVLFGVLSRITDRARLGSHCRIGKYSYVDGYLGSWSYIGDSCFISAKIGKFCSISSSVRVLTGRHAYKAPYVSTSPLFYSIQNPFNTILVKRQLFDEYEYADKDNKIPVIIGNDVWIGYGVSIIEGVTIADGAVILANATVTKYVPPYAIVGGVPAKIVGYRYEDDVIKKLLDIRWWENDIEWIKKNIDSMSDINNLLHNYQ